jgi:hypothetical protein
VIAARDTHVRVKEWWAVVFSVRSVTRLYNGDWLSLRLPIRLGVRHPSGTRDQLFFLLEIFFRQLRVCYFVALSLTRGRVCNLLLLLVLASAVPLGSESRHDHVLLSQFLRLSQPGGPGPHIYIPQEQGGPDVLPGTGFYTVALRVVRGGGKGNPVPEV